MRHQHGLEAIGDKWSLLILRDLMFTDKRSYGELQSSDEKIAPIYSQQDYNHLKQMV
jgi:DNA-binding HxlR family transcriptional regulator